MTVQGLEYEKVVSVTNKILAAALLTKGHETVTMFEEDEPYGRFYCLFLETKEILRDIKACRNGELEINYRKLDDMLESIDASIDIEYNVRMERLRNVLAAAGN